MQTIKHAYVSAMHGLGHGLYGSGLLGRDLPAPCAPTSRWLRSLFAIYDLEAMVALDLPWWTLRAARMVERHLAGRTAARVFEYGAGASTIFLARRAHEVLSVEHDPHWHRTVAAKAAAWPRVSLHLAEAPSAGREAAFNSAHPEWRDRDFRDYVRAIDGTDGLFDLIVIDGRCRSRCLEASLQRVKPDGIILFDNARRSRYRDALQRCPLPRLRTTGLTACLPYPDTTLLLSPSEGVLRALADA